jgi:DNA-binding transcriptional MerR regulator
LISSKEILIKTGISRATLNNYIALGILSKPLVRQPTVGEDDARVLGYFPDSALERIEQVRRMKAEGLSMADIVAQLGVKKEQASEGTMEPISQKIAGKISENLGDIILDIPTF